MTQTQLDLVPQQEPRREQNALDPMQMIQRAFESAIENKQGLEVVDRILEQQKWMIQHQEEQNFNAALRRIQDKLKPIVKRGKNEQTNSKYATADAIDREIEPLIQQEGMTLTFEPEASAQPLMIRVVGVLSLGAYSRRYPLEMPTDGQGPKGGGVMTRTHATGSAIAYGIRYLKRMIFNLQLKDDDGNAAGGKQAGSIDERRLVELLEFIKVAPNKAELQTQYLAALKEAEAKGDAHAIADIIAAKNKKLQELK
jgi:hypothetical protein